MSEILFLTADRRGALVRNADYPQVAQRAMAKRAGSAVVAAKGSHAIYNSQPKAVADLIEQAASKAKATPA